MGVSLIPYRLLEKAKDEYGYMCWKREAATLDFDIYLNAGHRDFISEIDDWDFVFDDDNNPIEGSYSRPSNIPAAKEWVKENIHFEGSRDQLLRLLEFMEQDPMVYIYISA